jgi:hypothetical protein
MTICKTYRVGSTCIFVLINHLYLLNIDVSFDISLLTQNMGIRSKSYGCIM